MAAPRFYFPREEFLRLLSRPAVDALENVLKIAQVIDTQTEQGGTIAGVQEALADLAETVALAPPVIPPADVIAVAAGDSDALVVIAPVIPPDPASGGGGGGSGTVTSVAAGVGLTATPGPITTAGTIDLDDTAITPATYLNPTVTFDQQGRATAASNGFHYFGGGYPSPVGPSEVLIAYRAPVAYTIAANLAAWQVGVTANPSATFALTVAQNGTTIGTISISTAGVVTLTTTGGTAKPIAVSDRVTVTAPPVVDTDIAGLAITARGTL